VAQNNEDLVPKVVLGPYKWTVRVLMEEVNINGDTLSPRVKTESLPGQLFDVLLILKDDVLIKITPYSTTTSAATLTYNIKSPEPAGGTREKDNLRYFKVSKEILQTYAVANSYILPSLTFGLLNFPFKYRTSFSGNGDFAGAFNFGAAIGISARKKSYKNRTFSFISGYSISNTVLNQSDVRRNEKDLVTANNYTSFSLSFGPMVEYNKIQVGAFIGFDFLNRLNQDRFGWRNQGKLWFSIGIGYTIFSKQGDEKVSTEVNKEPTAAGN
jgi:hypothetical protein